MRTGPRAGQVRATSGGVWRSAGEGNGGEGARVRGPRHGGIGRAAYNLVWLRDHAGNAPPPSPPPKCPRMAPPNRQDMLCPPPIVTWRVGRGLGCCWSCVRGSPAGASCCRRAIWARRRQMALKRWIWRVQGGFILKHSLQVVCCRIGYQRNRTMRAAIKTSVLSFFMMPLGIINCLAVDGPVPPPPKMPHVSV